MKFLLENEETERLRFRLLRKDDFNIWVKLFKGENAAKFLGMDESAPHDQLCQQWFDKNDNRYENDLGGMNVLVDKDSNEFVGQCGLLVQTVENIERMEIGYSILPQYWNKGYASEAAIKCKNYAFENNIAESLISIVHPENIGSEKVARKNGMELEKKLDSYKGMPVNIFRIDKTNWEKK